MALVHKALWLIERNLDRDLSLGEIAAGCGVTSYHLAHAFGAAAGMSVMHYVRARRLSAAAQALAQGAPDILDLALDAGYGSHEAFSRAFRAQFGATPNSVRRKSTTEDLPMTNPLDLVGGGEPLLSPPRFESLGPMLFVGLGERHAFGSPQNIPSQWRRFMAAFGDIPDKSDAIPVGVSANMDADGNFEYFCAAQVSKFSSTPPGLTQLQAPAQHYAVFTHSDHISGIGATYAAIWNSWLPENGWKATDGPNIERHLPTFDPRTGLGGVELFIPVEKAK